MASCASRRHFLTGYPTHNMRTNEPLLIDKKRAAYLLDLAVRDVDQLIARGDLQMKAIAGRQLIVYASLKSLLNATPMSGSAQPAHAI
jgi:hypothetical protein